MNIEFCRYPEIRKKAIDILKKILPVYNAKQKVIDEILADFGSCLDNFVNDKEKEKHDRRN